VEDDVSQIGVDPEQLALLRHATQMFEPLHTGVAPPQSMFERHCTQRFATASQMGAAALVQSEFCSQITHDPCFIPVVTHAGPAGLPAQSAFTMQGWQVWDTVLQVGDEPLQSELNSQPTHVPVGKSQIVVSPMHWPSFVLEHWPQAPENSHAGVDPPQSASDAQGLHLPPLQMGVLPPQSMLVRHWAHVLLDVQRGVAPPPQSMSEAHVTQSPAAGPVVAHTGVVPPQSAVPLQARHVSFVVSQIGFGLAQSELVRQPTHVLVGTSQTGVAPVHAAWFVAEQTAQMPEDAHAGVAPLHAESPSHAHGTPLVLISSS